MILEIEKMFEIYIISGKKGQNRKEQIKLSSTLCQFWFTSTLRLTYTLIYCKIYMCTVAFDFVS